MTILGIDYGTKRIGLALADEAGVRRYRTLETGETVTADLVGLIEAQEIDEVVVGLPRNAEGDDTTWTGEVRAFADTLTSTSNASVALVDEFGTSELARERLQQEKLSEAEVKQLLDQEVACMLLEEYGGTHA